MNDLFENLLMGLFILLALGIVGMVVVMMLPYILILLVFGIGVAIFATFIYLVIELATKGIEGFGKLINKVKSWFNA